MSLETAADRAVFIADDGVVVSWKVGAAAPVSLMALFDSGTIVQDGQETTGWLNRRGTLTLPEASLPAGAGAESDVVVIAGASYRPKAKKPDGQGMVVVTLEAVF